MRNRKTQSALLVAGAAAGVAAAATWLGRRRHLTAVDTHREHMVEPDSAELPLGRSADPAIDDALSRRRSAQDETSGASLLSEPPPRDRRSFKDSSLDEVWNAMPGFVESEQTEGYDAVEPEDLGAVWLERATQTTHDARPHANDRYDLPALDELVINNDDDEDDVEIEDDDLDEELNV